MLTDTQVRKAKGGEKAYKLSDSGGLFLLVSPTGSRSWRLKYRFGKVEKLLTFGIYPDVSLAEARERRDAAKRAIREGRDPGVEKKQQKAAQAIGTAHTFEACARAWHALNAPRWGKVHARNVINSLEADLFPAVGGLPVKDVTEALLLDALRKVEKRGAIETAARIRQRASDVFAYAAAAGLRTGDPAAVIKSLLKPKPKASKQPAITDIEALRQLIRDVEAAPASPITKLANRLVALTAVRSSVQRHCKWEHLEGLDGPSPLWRVPPSEMKLMLRLKDDETFEFLAPLSRQAVEVFEAIRPLTGHLPYVFPNDRHAHRPMTENAVRALIIRVADGAYRHKHCTHGYRSSFSSIMNEWRRKEGRPDDREVINLMLAHVVEDKVEGAYNRAAHMERRVELAQIWADMVLTDAAPAATLLEGPRN
ncbi:integrase arm-type DNA-binding domain-containing protein [Sphingomonas sp. MG17]|uniref:Integrase arm-type DNA-binding domain-containing protein n=1 Tax=Sphingomonas tagetis TaxID=2949092 RepID=A0A9X2HR56_9SPHN|nr:integrase arm-type DNA-binding domain-containing protein [Sphingomonas tagetis]MCP3731988.1 integrase arm-type DNA-binding domain-containing protein [Sphingomonas tagetis]